MTTGAFWIGIGFLTVGMISLLSIRYGWRWWWGARPVPRTDGETRYQHLSRLFTAWLCLAAGIYFLCDLAGIPPLYAVLIGIAFATLLMFSLPKRRVPR